MRPLRFPVSLLLALTIGAGFTRSASCQQDKTTRFAEISFTLLTTKAENALVRDRLLRIATTKQIRQGPVGLSGGLAGDNDYIIAILGSCDGAISLVKTEVEAVTADLPDNSTLLESFQSTARCADNEWQSTK